LDSLNVVSGIPFGGFGPGWLLPMQSESPSESQALLSHSIHTVDPAGMPTGVARAAPLTTMARNDARRRAHPVVRFPSRSADLECEMLMARPPRRITSRWPRDPAPSEAAFP
jgi:hypothetical protein